MKTVGYALTLQQILFSCTLVCLFCWHKAKCMGIDRENKLRGILALIEAKHS